MPHISIKMYPGRTEEVKKELAEKTNMEEKYISVSVEEYEKENWKEEVADKIRPEDLYVKSNF